VTKTVHGKDAADKAREAAKALFAGGGDADSIPCTEISEADFGDGMNIIDLLSTCGMIPSRGEGRRLVAQGGIRVNDKKITSHEQVIAVSECTDGAFLIQKGKKVYQRVKLT
jgi:tyrosyl-tRNA synthetase